jgi:asparagine synthetase B (glutamine-hydrolysing)
VYGIIQMTEDRKRMRGFLAAYGTPDAVSALQWNSADAFLRKRETAFETVEAANSSVGRTIKALQLYGPSGGGKILPHFGNYILLHGTVFGPAGKNDNSILNPADAGRTLAELAAANSAFTPYDVDGDCSICLIPRDARGIVIFGDRIGYRRIFHYRENGLLIVSTQLRLILLLRQRNWALNSLAARGFLAGREPAWPLSIVEGIHRLAPVHCLRASEDEISIAPFWRPSPKLRESRLDVMLSGIHETLAYAVKRRVLDAPAVVYLSGGYDSTCLAKLAPEVSTGISAMSAAYEGAAVDETIFAERIAAHLKVPFLKRIFTLRDTAEMAERLADILDQPAHDPVSYLLLSEAARQQSFSVAITGMGGDALFKRNRHLARCLRSWRILKHAGRIQPLVRQMPALARLGRDRGPLDLCRIFAESPQPETFEELYWRYTRGSFVLARTLLGSELMHDLRKLAALRDGALQSLRKQAGTHAERNFYWGVWSFPDEFHADFSISAFHMDTSMPFADPLVVDEMLGNAYHHDLDNTEIQMKIFGGIPVHLMNPEKYGFFFPYEKYVELLISRERREAFQDKSWEKMGVSIDAMERSVAEAKKSLEETEAMLYDLEKSRILWRLIMLYRFIESCSLRMP